MENVNKIIKAYKEEQKRLTKTRKDVTLEKKDKEIISNQIDIKKQNLHIERLKEERKKYENSTRMDYIDIRDEYNRTIKKEEEILEKQKDTLESLKEERKGLAINKDKVNAEVKKKILQKMNENQDKLRKDLTTEKKRLELENKKLKVQYDMKMIEIHEFKYQYDEKGLPTNGEEYRKMNEEALKIYDDMKKGKENLELCKKQLEKNIEVISDMPKLSEYEIYDENVLKEKETIENKGIESKVNEEQKENKNYKNLKTEKEANKIKENAPKQEKKEEKSVLKGVEKKDIEQKIEKVQQEMENENKNYGKIHLEAEKYVDKVNMDNSKQEKKEEKAKLENIEEKDIEQKIKKVQQEMDEQNRNYKNIHLGAGRYADKVNINIPKEEKKQDKINYIGIKENEGNIEYYLDGDEQVHTISIKEALDEKKEKFKRLGISDMCKEIAGGRIKGALLKRKINPEIVAVLENNSEQLEEYINCIHEKKKLSFDLVHNLLDTSILSKIKLNRYVKAEKKAGAYVCGNLFDKNNAIIAKEKTKALAGKVKENVKDKTEKSKDFSQEKMSSTKSKRKRKDFVPKVFNKNNEIEAKAKAALAEKESEKELAEGVKAVMGQEEKERE